MTWILAALSIVGVVLNIYKNPLCFWIWAFTNFSWIIIDWRAKIYGQAFLFAVYFILAIWGIMAW